MEKQPEHTAGDWESLPEWDELRELISKQVALHVDRHPGIITEAMVEALLRRYDVNPRESFHRERRKNHPERIRRISHAAFRALDEAEEMGPVQRIALGVLKAFIVSPRSDRENPEDAGPP